MSHTEVLRKTKRTDDKIVEIYCSYVVVIHVNVKPTEIQAYEIAESHDLCEILDRKDLFITKMPKYTPIYEEMVRGVMKESVVALKIIEMLNFYHSQGIFHNDIGIRNIGVEKITGNWRLYDLSSIYSLNGESMKNLMKTLTNLLFTDLVAFGYKNSVGLIINNYLQ